MTKKRLVLAFAVVLSFSATVKATILTGNPAVDAGWSFAGHALENGVYVKGSANYGYETFSAAFTVQSGSDLEIVDANDSALDWLVGDTVIGVGGRFSSITAAGAGWAAFTGDAVNSRLPASSGPKLQVKFGTSDATWAASTIAPGSGDGNSSSSSGGGRVQVRTSAYFQAGTPTPGQTEPWTWDGNSNQLLVLDKDSHIDWDGASSQPSKYTARMIWNWDAGLSHVTSWELLLNVSLLGRQAPGDFMGLMPAPGDPAIMTVQDNDGPYTDALVNIVPEPATLGLLMAVGIGVVRRRR
ncbi:MAG: PEP-CTERM sorting domain-containing protein [Phycisphaerales bacterium]|nr:PEP-CTERM sorting domain-containing protein [Phycisphaerales bacterium]MCB9856485.1 PEP-CTERM sorting domain-containing protein [Phycisphaerales bacterium]MCB9863966.1 PEP-CTERM sorting domain-containing protein [Phycisphaerales bacterium]